MEKSRKVQGIARAQASIKKQVVSIVAICISVSITVFALAYFQSEVMNGVRAYVRGEGLWAKAQKDAVIALQNFTLTGDLSQFKRYQSALKIPLGDKDARVALESNIPDKQKALEGLIQGQNSPEDSESMIWFFLWFQDFPYMREAIDIWRQADDNLIALQKIGGEIYRAKSNDDTKELNRLLAKLSQIDSELSELEFNFSKVLSEGSIWIKRASISLTFFLLLLMLLFVLKYSRRVVSSIEQKENDLLVSESRFKSLFDSDMVGIIEWHTNGEIFEANQAFFNIIGYQREEFFTKGISWHDLSPASSSLVDQKALQQISEKGCCTPYEKEYIHKNGQHVPVLVGAALLGGESQKGIAFILDLSEKQHIEEEAHLLASVFDSSSNGALLTDKEFKVVNVNHNYLQTSGFTESSLLGAELPLLSSTKVKGQRNNIIRQLKRTHRYQGDVIDISASGRERPVLLSVSGIYNSENDLTHYSFNLTDISKRKAMEEKFKTMAHHDPLTGLANRALLSDTYSRALSRAKRNKTALALLFLDLDKFKPVNDEYGHEVGDQLLKEVAIRLCSTIRQNDSVARLGGDEFVILLEDLVEASFAGQVAEKIIEALSLKFLINNISLQVSCSIGISLFPNDADAVEEMIRCADIAMYKAKANGKNQFHYFKSELGSRN